MATTSSRQPKKAAVSKKAPVATKKTASKDLSSKKKGLSSLKKSIASVSKKSTSPKPAPKPITSTKSTGTQKALSQVKSVISTPQPSSLSQKPSRGKRWFFVLFFTAILANLAIIDYRIYTEHFSPQTPESNKSSNTSETTGPVQIISLASQKDDLSQALMTLQLQIFPGSKTISVDPESGQGKGYITQFGLKYVPAIILTGDVKHSNIAQYIDKITVQKGNEYLLNLDSLRMEVQKRYLEVPTLTDRDITNAKGPKDAKVTIIEFSDFQCPFCKRFYENTYEKLLSTYGNQVRIVFKHLPLVGLGHSMAPKAAEAFECAADEGKQWELHDKMFTEQPKITIDDIKQYATDLGMGTAFNECLDSGKYAGKVEADSKQAEEFAIQGTPSFFIGNNFLGGAYPFENFKQLIDEELKK